MQYDVGVKGGGGLDRGGFHDLRMGDLARTNGLAQAQPSVTVTNISAAKSSSSIKERAFPLCRAYLQSIAPLPLDSIIAEISVIHPSILTHPTLPRFAPGTGPAVGGAEYIDRPFRRSELTPVDRIRLSLQLRVDVTLNASSARRHIPNLREGCAAFYDCIYPTISTQTEASPQPLVKERHLKTAGKYHQGLFRIRRDSFFCYCLVVICDTRSTIKRLN